MIDAVHHIELDGEKYKLAQSEQGDHYVVGQEPLRPPNAVTVQGETPQKFQARLDTLLWSWTDWSAGEGQVKFDPQNPGRAFRLDAVRAFEQPGKLRPGFYLDDTSLDEAAALVNHAGTLYALNRDTAEAATWGGSSWGSMAAITGPTDGANQRVASDNANMFWVEVGTQNVYKWTGSGSATTISTALITSESDGLQDLVQLADYVYVATEGDNSVFEIAKSGSTESEIDAFTETMTNVQLEVMDGKVYLMYATAHDTVIRQITPTTSAGAGFGAEIARFVGLHGSLMWAHSGQIFVFGKYTEDTTVADQTVMYFQPSDKTYGTLGNVREGQALAPAVGGAQRMLDHFFVTQDRATSEQNQAIWQIDSVTGGFANVAFDEDDHLSADADFVRSIATIDGEIFISSSDQSTNDKILRANPAEFSKSSEAISPYNDFAFAGQKYLGSLELSCEPLPADWTVYVDYQIDNDGTWTNAITYTTTSGTGTKVPVTTDSATVEFRVLALRLRMEYGGGGVPTDAPTILGVEAYAAVAQKVGVYNLMIDLNDSQSAGDRSRGGSVKASLLRTTCEKDVAVDFKDGYTDRQAGQYNQYDVTVDTWRMILERPGEGYAMVQLREVV